MAGRLDVAGRRRHGRRARGVLLVAALSALGPACSDSDSAAPPPTTASAVPAVPAGSVAPGKGTWRRIPPAPIPAAWNMATLWTGKVLIVWGGELAADEGRAGTAGAAYDPATDRWQALPPAPVAGRVRAITTWTGQEMLLWGGQSGDGATFADGAAYNPATRQWRVLPAAPIGPRGGAEVAWTGREMLVWGGYEQCCPIDSVVHAQDAAAYDPAADTWRRIAPVPPPWSGDDGGAVTAVVGGRPFVWREGRLAALSRAEDEWSGVPDAPDPPEPSPDRPVFTTSADPLAVGVAAGDEVFVWAGSSGRLSGAAYRPAGPAGPGDAAKPDDGKPDERAPAGSRPPEMDGGWRRTAPLDAQSGVTVAAGGPGSIFAAAGRSSVVLEYRVAEDRWEELPPAPVAARSAATLVWTGSELIFWGGIGDEGPEMDGARWHCC